MKAIERALKVNAPVRRPVEVLARVGGAEIGGLRALPGGSGKRVLFCGRIHINGRALLACEIEPKVKQYLIPSHMSMERGYRAMLERMGLRPLLDPDLRLGEGTGAAIAMLVVTAALRAYNEMATFAEASGPKRNALPRCRELTVPRSGKEFIFVTGGRRSGKSSYAPGFGESLGKRRLYIATAGSLTSRWRRG